MDVRKLPTDDAIDAIISQSRLIDDQLMSLVFEENVEATQCVLNVILERDDFIVKSVQVQRVLKNPVFNGHDIRVDILAEDQEGNVYNIEIQRAGEGADPHRARFNCSVIDQRMLKAGQSYKELKESYVIFITEHDYLGKGLPLYHADRIIAETNEPLGDGSHIIYANADYDDESTEMGKMMHDFKCTDPDSMYNEPLKKSVKYYKDTKGGRGQMSNILDEYVEQKAAEILAEGEMKGRIKERIAVYREIGYSDDKIKKLIMEKCKLSSEVADEYMKSC